MSKNKEHKKLAPELRFPEFDGEWEETTLDEISPSIFDGTHQTPKYTDQGIPFFSVENIISGSKNKFISREAYLYATKKNKPEFGDILITRIGSIGVPKVVDWNYEFSIYVTLAVVKKSEQFDSYYLEAYIQSDRFQKEIRRRSLLKAAPQKINMNELRNCEVLLPPTCKEQQKIAATLTSLDHLIAAEQEKRDALQAHKKGLLQQLFPAPGQKVPKVRFGEFRGEWEEKALGDIGKPLMCKRIFKEQTTSDPNNAIPFYKIGTFGKDADAYIPVDLYKEYKSRFSYPNVGDILISASGTIGRLVVYDGADAYYQDSNIVWLGHNERDVINSFLYYCYSTLDWQTSDGGVIKRLYNSNLKEMVIFFPKEKKEQQKIANCLSSLDDLIAAQSKKIEALQEHKKGLMQQMFPELNTRRL